MFGKKAIFQVNFRFSYQIIFWCGIVVVNLDRYDGGFWKGALEFETSKTDQKHCQKVGESGAEDDQEGTGEANPPKK